MSVVASILAIVAGALAVAVILLIRDNFNMSAELGKWRLAYQATARPEKRNV